MEGALTNRVIYIAQERRQDNFVLSNLEPQSGQRPSDLTRSEAKKLVAKRRSDAQELALILYDIYTDNRDHNKIGNGQNHANHLKKE